MRPLMRYFLMSRIGTLRLTGHPSAETVAGGLPGFFASPMLGLTSLEFQQIGEPARPFASDDSLRSAKPFSSLGYFRVNQGTGVMPGSQSHRFFRLRHKFRPCRRVEGCNNKEKGVDSRSAASRGDHQQHWNTAKSRGDPTTPKFYYMCGGHGGRQAFPDLA